MRFFLLRSKSFGLLRKLKPTQNAFCNEVKQKKKRQTCTHTRHISHTHTNTPFRYLLWSELSHLRKKKKGQKFEQEAWKQSSNNSPTQWYIVVFGGRYWNGTWDLQPCPFCLTCCTFHLKSESWDFESVPDVRQDAWLFSFFFHFGGRNETLHPASCCDSQQDIVKCAQFFCPDLCTTWKSTACLLHGQFQ